MRVKELKANWGIPLALSIQLRRSLSQRSIPHSQWTTLLGIMLFLSSLAGVANADTYAQIDNVNFGPSATSLGLVTAGTGMAIAAYNDLGASYVGNGFADAGFNDVVTAPVSVTVGGVTYNVAALQFTVTLTGTITPQVQPPNPNLATGFGSLAVDDIGGCAVQTKAFYSIPGGWPGSASCSVPVNLPFGITAIPLAGYVEADALGGSSNFLGTFTISNIEAFSANGMDLGSVDLVGQSGTVYGASPVPEPCTMLLLVAGVIPSLVFRCRVMK